MPRACPPKMSDASSSRATPEARRAHLEELIQQLQRVPDGYDALPSSHPLKIAARTFSLGLSFSLVPALLGQLLSGKIRPTAKLRATLARELSPTGFPFAMAVAFGGGAALESWWTKSGVHSPTSSRDSLVAHALSSALAMGLIDLRAKAWTHGIASAPPPRKQGVSAGSSPTLDFTLLLLVRALDSIVQSWIRRESTRPNKRPEYAQRIKWLDAQLDGVLFWLCSARIMWAFFYLPQTLPRSYVQWINALARIDPRLQLALRAVRDGTWAYGQARSASESALLQTLATSMGFPADWGNPKLLPAHSGTTADIAWAKMGLKSRPGVGGIPCELIHGRKYGASCTINATGRAAQAFFQALAIYAPVHALPVLLSEARRRKLLRRPMDVLLRTTTNTSRSAAFLASFVGLIWATICASRTGVIPRIPGLRGRLSHQYLDGPHGAVLFGCMVCGLSIFIETPSRRGEIALYVMPRALRSLLRGSWISRDNRPAHLVERTVAVLCLAWLAMAAKHDAGSLRGLSRWVLSFAMRGRAPPPPSGAVTPMPAFTPARTPTPPPRSPKHEVAAAEPSGQL
ncbi:hypothetical protein BKA62DRAFT_694497 [Auriculariales sp. MPI-PUGE-AT-0066]|nr:hypothetical protein BKA62DRAFT_694497 [Auriculariales sp. MPI-PUGE-AT-0066]